MIHQLFNLIGIGRPTRTDDSGEVQRIQLTERAAGQGGDDRISEKVPRLAEFGFTSALPDDAEVLVIRRGGDRSLAVAIASGHRASRPRDLKPGDTVIYDQRGNQVRLTEEGIEVRAVDAPVKVTGATTIEVTASDLITLKTDAKLRVEADRIECTGDVVSRADGTPVSLNALRDAYHAHKHGGVKSGTDTSGGTDHDA